MKRRSNHPTLAPRTVGDFAESLRYRSGARNPQTAAPLPVARRRGGFTLIELLAVIAVVAILAALVFAGLANVRDDATNAKSISNLRQCAAAQLLRLNETGRIFETGRGGTVQFLWANQLVDGGYLDDRQVALSPWNSEGMNGSREGTAWFTYGLNLYQNSSFPTDENGNRNTDINELNWSNIEEPSNYMMFAESYWPQQSGPNRIRGVFRIPLRNASGFGGVYLPYKNKTNVAFLDGSVDRVGPERLKRMGLNSGFGPDGETINF